jgi:hypothetical protein
MANYCIAAFDALTVADGTPPVVSEAKRLLTSVSTVSEIVAPATLQSLLAANLSTPLYSDLDPATGLQSAEAIETIEEAKAFAQGLLNNTGLAARAVEVNVTVALGTRVF